MLFRSILYLNAHICKYGAMYAGSSYIDLSDMIKSKQACINVINREDNHCFKWALLSELITKKFESEEQYFKHPERLNKYYEYENSFTVDFIENHASVTVDLSQLPSPTPTSEIPRVNNYDFYEPNGQNDFYRVFYRKIRVLEIM